MIPCMKLQFQSKEESKRKQEDAFLTLHPSERIYHFLELIVASKKIFPDTKDRSKNFQIIINCDRK